MKIAILIPAYGKTHKESKDVLEYYNANKDFKMRNIGVPGSYCNKRDLMKYTDFTHVELRYGRNLEHLAMVNVNGRI